MLSQAFSPSPFTKGATVKVTLEPLPELHRLAALWRHVEERADASFFLSWTWISTWLTSIERRPELVIARIDKEVVGLGLVLSRLIVRHRVMPVWTLFLHQTGSEDQDVITIEYNDFLIDRRVEEETRSACLRFLLQRRDFGGRRVGEIALCGLHEARSNDLSSLGRPVRELAVAGSARVDLGSIRKSGQSFYDGLKSSTARRIRRSMALYQARGEIEVTAAETIEDALAFFDAAGVLHQERWTSKGHPGAFAYPFYVDFHRRLINRALPEGQVELLRIAVAGEPIGFLYNFLYRGQVYYYFSGFRFEADNRLKPGLVCHSLCIERHLAAGMDVYDFMGGEQRYKTELGKPGPQLISLAVQRPNLLLAAERPLRQLKQALEGRRSAKAPIS